MLNVRNSFYQSDLENVANQVDIRVIYNTKFLITGATGLIGSFLVDFLLYLNEKYNSNIKVYAMSRSKERLQKRFSYFNNDSKNLMLIEQDVCDSVEISESVDYIISAASNADPRNYALYPAETILTNILGTKNVLDFAMKNKNTKVLFTSTMEVYGEIDSKDSFSEDDYGLIDYNEIRSSYPESKRVSEILCRSYLKEFGVKSIICRLGYIYGPTMTSGDSKVIAQFIKNVLKGENIILKSKGEQKRSYCYVADAVAGMLVSLIKGEPGEAYNIANSNSITSIKDMASLIASINGLTVEYHLPDEIEKAGFSKAQDAVMDESKLRSLGWNPIYDMEEGVKNTLEILADKN